MLPAPVGTGHGAASMARAEDRIGQRFGHWTIVGVGRRQSGAHMFRCLCDCGRRQWVPSNNLYSGQSTRCRGCQAAEMRRRHDERAAAQVGARRGTLTITGWRRTRGRLQLRWVCDCGKSGWTPDVKGPGPGCPRCSGRDRARERAAVRHAGVAYTFTDLAALIGVSRQRATDIYRKHGKAEVLRRAGLLGGRGGPSR